MIKCPNCGGELKFKPKDKVVKCEYCSTKFNPKELRATVKSADEEVNENGTTKATSYRCSQCGGTLLTFDETAITFCSYCGSQAMIKQKMVDINNPDFIIPFKITKEDCIKAYKRKINSSIFAPSYMKDDIVVEKFRGIYMPYCVYKSTYHGATVNHGKRYSHHWASYDYYNNYEIDAQVDADYEGISYDLVSKLYDKYTHHIPFDYKDAEPFNPNYLTGYYADARDVKPEAYDEIVKSTIRDDCNSKLRRDFRYSWYGCRTPKVGMRITDRKVGMFPVYFLAIRDKNKKDIHYAVVNGQTGEVAMDIPIDFTKYIIGSIIISALFFFLLNKDLLFEPKAILIISILSLIIGIIITNNQARKLEDAKKHYDDLGYTTANEISTPNLLRRKPIEKGTRPFLKFYIIGIVVGAIILMMNPFEDNFYYIPGIINFIIVICSFYDLVKKRNLLVSTKLPQLEKRGGDENA